MKNKLLLSFILIVSGMNLSCFSSNSPLIGGGNLDVFTESLRYEKMFGGLSSSSSEVKNVDSKVFSQSASNTTAQSPLNSFKRIINNQATEKISFKNTFGSNAAQANSSKVFKSVLSLAKKNKYFLAGGAVATVGVFAYNKYGVKEERKEKPQVNETQSENKLVYEKNSSNNLQQESLDHQVNVKQRSYLEQFYQYCPDNLGRTVGAVATIGVIGYGLYKLYNSEFFAESKKSTEKVQ